MIDVFATVLTFAALGAAVWALLLIVINRPLKLDRPVSLALIGAVAVVETGLLVQAIAGVVNMLSTDRSMDRLSFVAYLFGPVVILPLATVWAMAERSRWGPGVLVAGCLAIPVMILRLRQIWDGNA
jgi:hypothetical protein